MRSPNRRRHAALAVASVGLVMTAACGAGGGGRQSEDAKRLVFQPVAAPGPAPFTASAADTLPRGADPATGSRAPAGPRVARARALPGSTPGLYGGVRSATSCDVERLIRYLTEKHGTARAFARAAAVRGVSVPTYLRDLTPVTLRADTRVTAHGLLHGRATTHQAVLQAGTAVLADAHGMPRVRCASGGPLGPARPMEGEVAQAGALWRGYRPDRVVVVTPVRRPLGGLVIVDDVRHAWVERPAGTDGSRDREPDLSPPYRPDADVTDPQTVTPPATDLPDAPLGGVAAAGPRATSAPVRAGADPSRQPAARGTRH